MQHIDETEQEDFGHHVNSGLHGLWSTFMNIPRGDPCGSINTVGMQTQRPMSSHKEPRTQVC